MLRRPPKATACGSRDFDQRVGDDIHDAMEQMRMQIATGTRQAASLNGAATSEVRAVHELGAAIVETVRTGRECAGSEPAQAAAATPSPCSGVPPPAATTDGRSILSDRSAATE
jgi:hypothetical protein